VQCQGSELSLRLFLLHLKFWGKQLRRSHLQFRSQIISVILYIYTRNAEFPLTDLVPSFSWSFRSLLWMDSASGAPGCSMAAVSIVTHAEFITVIHSCACGRLPTRCLATFASSHILGFWKASVFGSQPLTIYHLILSYTPSARTPDLLQECCNGKRSQRSFPPSRICHSSTAAIDASVPRKWAKAAYLQSGGADTQNTA